MYIMYIMGADDYGYCIYIYINIYNILYSYLYFILIYLNTYSYVYILSYNLQNLQCGATLPGSMWAPIYLAALVAAASADAVVSTPFDAGVYGLSAVDIDGKNVSLAQYAGNVSLFVNVATY